jgi:hypothetical protein
METSIFVTGVAQQFSFHVARLLPIEDANARPDRAGPKQASCHGANAGICIGLSIVVSPP